jgi:hypothetical protein
MYIHMHMHKVVSRSDQTARARSDVVRREDTSAEEVQTWRGGELRTVRDVLVLDPG